MMYVATIANVTASESSSTIGPFLTDINDSKTQKHSRHMDPFTLGQAPSALHASPTAAPHLQTPMQMPPSTQDPQQLIPQICSVPIGASKSNTQGSPQTLRNLSIVRPRSTPLRSSQLVGLLSQSIRLPTPLCAQQRRDMFPKCCAFLRIL